jgi:hypothetical protein
MVCLRNISVDTLHKEIPRIIVIIIIIIINQKFWIFIDLVSTSAGVVFVVLHSHPRKIPGYCLLKDHKQFLTHVFQAMIH